MRFLGGTWVEAASNIVLAGLIGRGIARSRTPEMHMAEAAAQSLRGVYRIIDVDTLPEDEQNLKAIVHAAEVTGFNGLNVTYPFKMEVIPLLDQLSPNAAAVGSVNTIVFRDGKRIGHNTDLWGFAESFRQNMIGVSLKTVLLIGAGGAGVAVAHALADCGVQHLKIFDVDTVRVEQLARQVRSNRQGLTVEPVTTLDAASCANLSGIVNASPVGMAKTPGTPFPLALLKPDMWVADIVYFPLETELLAGARRLGCRVLPGSGMAVFQAVRAFELFTGRRADPVRMKAAFDAFDEMPRETADA
ncbi:shikimate dehydrogenase [Roseibium aggregatum]|jgi:shikimate dehydrogenase|uniref:shikimate dehydrogenase n=1 Tax=Roseibium aggregatum TaxID=187304 RepID=UPI001E621153|nr:shikimate dehydrogenase [Roseibium aggregatum]UES39324.1 shikimate dehydrogenase [Roseibium aggregatum]UES54195.1 shikimate dehydrogenase [Roseibium aggregatum]WJS04421.1 shikimate dehydrogenase [Roseibium aggregatum]